eukprot:TRINITY_DN49_c0_g1_i1.p1 TRINITY_DN49_c0_g1~~TRINITY_DN49_c0_g1_i1.p1  ORF type:complete len:188 (-),score=39.98 TRINITY_DN49_c0_g1_i1:142-705(-)
MEGKDSKIQQVKEKEIRQPSTERDDALVERSIKEQYDVFRLFDENGDPVPRPGSKQPIEWVYTDADLFVDTIQDAARPGAFLLGSSNWPANFKEKRRFSERLRESVLLSRAPVDARTWAAATTSLHPSLLKYHKQQYGRRNLDLRIYRYIGVSIVLGVIGFVWYKYEVQKPRIKAYETYYQTLYSKK